MDDTGPVAKKASSADSTTRLGTTKPETKKPETTKPETKAGGPDKHGPVVQKPADSTKQASATKRSSADDPLRMSRTSGLWIGVGVLAVLLILLAIFIAQNTQNITIAFLGFEGQAPASAMLLIAAAAGALLVVIAGSLRILQLRWRVRRSQKG